MGHVELFVVRGTHEEQVKARWPEAVAEKEVWPYDAKSEYWTVWDNPRSVTHGVRWHGDVARSRILLGQGRSEAEVWLDAARNVRRMEGWV